MIVLYILLSYLIGCIMLFDSLKMNGHLIVMDIVMFILSPFSIPNFLLVKVVSHFVDLDKIVVTEED